MEFEKIREFAMMMEHETDGSKMFGKKTYDDAFNTLFDKYKDIMQEYVNSCGKLDTDELPGYRRQVGAAFIDQEEKRLAAVPARNRKVRLYDDNLYMALFVIPAIGYFKTEQTDALAQTLVELWREQYPQHPINRGNYDDISTGFKKRHFCYITTAVCESLGKDDSCEELTCLRNFRDHWLLLTENGPSLVDQYYESAPRVLAVIQKRPDYREICADIYKFYIRPCIELIDQERYEDCKNHYMAMVDGLKHKYLGKEGGAAQGSI